MSSAGARFASLVATLFVGASMLAGAAVADTVTNTLSAIPGSDTVAAGSTTMIGYRVNPQNSPDPENGCNAKGASPANVTIVKPAAVTVSPPWLVFSGCVTLYANFSASVAGDYVISVTVNDSGPGTYATAGATFTLRVVATDTTPPELLLPADISAEATGPAGAVVSYAASATDAQSGSVAVACAPASGSTFPLGDTTVSCSASDGAGNTAHGAFHVVVRDTTPPAFTGSVAPEAVVEATGPGGAVVPYVEPTATDSVSSATVGCVAPSGSVFPLGRSSVACTATDDAGNSATAYLSVNVVDTTPPALALGEDLVVEASGPAGATVVYAAGAADLVDPAPAVACEPPSGATFGLGTSVVACTATDSADNAAVGSFRVTVVDATAPALTLPADITQEATGPEGALVAYEVRASDLVDGETPVACDRASGATFPLGATRVTCGATDAAGNAASGSFDVLVADTTPPALALPDDIIAEASGPDGASVSYVASAEDLVSGATGVVCSPASGSTFALGETLVSCASEDAAGNRAEGALLVVVRDTTPPEVGIAGIAEGDSFVFGSVPAASCWAVDLVSGPVACALSGWSDAVGGQTLVATARDAAGNEASVEVRYAVAAWTLAGYWSPVPTGTSSGSSGSLEASTAPWISAKKGSTIPLKFEVFAGATELTSTGAIRSIGITRYASCSDATTASWDAAQSTGATSLRYDATSGQFIFNWKTPASAGCYRVTTTSLDGSTLLAHVQLR